MNLFFSNSRLGSIAVVATAGICLLLASPVFAIGLCASTAQDLHDDLAKASDNGLYAGQDVEIDLVRGTYNVEDVYENGLFTYTSTANSGRIAVVGGFTPGCADSIPDASATILDGGNLRQVLSIENDSNEVIVSFLTIQNGYSSSLGGGVFIYSESGTILLDDNIIQNNHMGGEGGGFAVEGGGAQISVVGNLVVGNSSGYDYGAGYIISIGEGTAFLEQNTIYGNSTSKAGGVGGVYCCSFTSTSTVDGNILWDNTNFGIDFEGTAADFAYNDVGTMTGVTPNTNVANIAVAPKFVDAANQDFRLAGDSKLLGVYQTQGSPRTDLSGDGYPASTINYIDIGAFEETIFTDHGFEGK